MSVRSFVWAVGLIAAGVSVAGVGQAVASDGPELPFERHLAGEDAGKYILRFNDFSGRITGDRIKALLRSGDVLGEPIHDALRAERAALRTGILEPTQLI